MSVNRIIIAGFGGQGILSMGRLLAYAGMVEGKNVSWLPSYGPEMRGGTANCHVIISDEEIGSPILNTTDTLIAMNEPSLDKFEDLVISNGIILADRSLVDRDSSRKDVQFQSVPATRIAERIGNATYANIVLLGRYVGLTGAIKECDFERALKNVLPEKYHHMIAEELVAFERGMSFGE